MDSRLKTTWNPKTSELNRIHRVTENTLNNYLRAVKKPSDIQHTHAEPPVNAVIVYYEYKVKRNKFRDFTQKIAFDVQHNYLHNSENNRSVHCVHFVKINTHSNSKCISELSGKQICWSITNPLNEFQSLAFSAVE